MPINTNHKHNKHSVYEMLRYRHVVWVYWPVEWVGCLGGVEPNTSYITHVEHPKPDVA